ncbi:hypothetical protein L3X38_042296 [Prunus dulcis]|uniref:Uncharacterized protein n=1 Tax=Prunus dulcis TaxID=3755 RepID=A0AAD4UWA7_PRUDU|nr:hypothetical protein L3X38_042296 [Prunus dulcis]
MRFTSSTEKEPNSSMTFDEQPKSSSGINTMSRVVKRKIQKIKHVVEYNKRGIPHGMAAVEMQSYIGVLAHTRVFLVDKKWTELPKDTNEQIWEAVQMASVVGQRGKKLVLSSAAKKWKDFKSTLLKQFILPFTNDKENGGWDGEVSRWEGDIASSFGTNLVEFGGRMRRWWLKEPSDE